MNIKLDDAKLGATYLRAMQIIDFFPEKTFHQVAVQALEEHELPTTGKPLELILLATVRTVMRRAALEVAAEQAADVARHLKPQKSLTTKSA